MKCATCPLCVSDYSDYVGDGDIYCLITRQYASDEGGCRRTNKFILSVDKKKLVDEWMEDEAHMWTELANYYEENNPANNLK